MNNFGRVWKILLIIWIFSIGFLIPPAHSDSGFLSHINYLRAQHGLNQLVESSTLDSIAYNHSLAMARQNNIFHNTALTSQVCCWQTLGENVGMGPSVNAINVAFDNSPEHYANEINPNYTEAGVGIVINPNGEIFVTIDFEQPAHQSSAVPLPRPPARSPGHANLGAGPNLAQTPLKNQIIPNLRIDKLYNWVFTLPSSMDPDSGVAQKIMSGYTSGLYQLARRSK